jgi:L-threonylcarbamoyladenylate synthase
MQTEVLPANNTFALPHAVDVLKNGGLVAFPTDTVYGLGALAFDIQAIERLYVVKGRNNTKAIALLIGSVSELDQVAVDVSKSSMKLADKFWPGPLTLILNRHPQLPDVLAPLPTIGVRVPNHPLALALLERTGPLAVTSANLAGKSNASTTQEVLSQLDGRIHLILDGGRSPGGVPSTIVDCTTPELKILRPGPISKREFKRALA